MLDALLILALALPSRSPAPPAPAPLEAPIAEVTVFPGQALVHRRAELERPDGAYVVSGLPWGMDPGSVRASCAGAVVVGIETRERKLPAVSDARIEELRAERRRLERELQELRGRVQVLSRLDAHLQGLLDLEAENHQREVREGRSAAEVWARNLEFLGTELQHNADQRRELGWTIEDRTRELAAVKFELGRDAGEGALVRDVVVELAGARGPASLDLEYLVGGAGWHPVYDLRAAADARSVDLAYRAEVCQRTGEDWNDVELLLSTARPSLGAQGPDARPIWLTFAEPRRAGGKAEELEGLRALGYTADDAAPKGDSFFLGQGAGEPASLEAAVEREGLSARFRLATRETIASREQPTNVLVGQARFDVAPEYYAAPALDTNVWLRGKATNTSDWILLPGRAAVYFGADFVGHAQLAAVQPGQQFDLHLGADPGLSLERTRIGDLTKAPGLFGSRERREEGWRIEVANHGAAVGRPQGGARVLVRVALPRPRNDAIEVDLARAEPRPSNAERWRADRADLGILTWELSVPEGETAQIVYETRVAYPEGRVVAQR